MGPLDMHIDWEMKQHTREKSSWIAHVVFCLFEMLQPIWVENKSSIPCTKRSNPGPSKGLSHRNICLLLRSYSLPLVISLTNYLFQLLCYWRAELSWKLNNWWIEEKLHQLIVYQAIRNAAIGSCWIIISQKHFSSLQYLKVEFTTQLVSMPWGYVEAATVTEDKHYGVLEIKYYDLFRVKPSRLD